MSIWFPAERFNWDGLKKDKLMSCFLSKIFYLTEDRIIYGEPLSYDLKDKAFYQTLEFAKEYVENHRIQGSSWTIQELPAIACIGEKVILIVTEINTLTPLKRYTNLDFEGEIEKIYHTFSAGYQNSVIRFIGDDKYFRSSDSTYKSFYSHTIGNTPLGWNFSQSWLLDLIPISEIIHKLTLAIQH